MATFGKSASVLLLVAAVLLLVGSITTVDATTGGTTLDLVQVEYVDNLRCDVLVNLTTSALGEIPSTFVRAGETAYTAVNPSVVASTEMLIVTVYSGSDPAQFSTPGSLLNRGSAATGFKLTFNGSCTASAGEQGLLIDLQPLPAGVDVDVGVEEEICAPCVSSNTSCVFHCD